MYADRTNSYQVDLRIEPYANSKKELILQAILCVINIIIKYAFAQAVNYYKNYKGMDNKDWRKKACKSNSRTKTLLWYYALSKG